MELRPRPRVSGPRTKPRATSLGRGCVSEQENSSVARETLVGVPSSAIMTTSGGGEFPPHVSPVQGGGARAFAPLARSESAGGAVRPPQGDPSRRSGSLLRLGYERCDAGRVGTIAQRPAADIAVSGSLFCVPTKVRILQYFYVFMDRQKSKCVLYVLCMCLSLILCVISYMPCTVWSQLCTLCHI